jgi:hypothetical protein
MSLLSAKNKSPKVFLSHASAFCQEIHGVSVTLLLLLLLLSFVLFFISNVPVDRLSSIDVVVSQHQPRYDSRSSNFQEERWYVHNETGKTLWTSKELSSKKRPLSRCTLSSISNRLQIAKKASLRNGVDDIEAHVVYNPLEAAVEGLPFFRAAFASLCGLKMTMTTRTVAEALDVQQMYPNLTSCDVEETKKRLHKRAVILMQSGTLAEPSRAMARDLQVNFSTPAPFSSDNPVNIEIILASEEYVIAKQLYEFAVALC